MGAGDAGTRRSGARVAGARFAGTRFAGAGRGLRAGLRAGRFFTGRAGFFRRGACFFDRFVARAFAFDRAGRAAFRFFAIHPSRLKEQARILARNPAPNLISYA